MIQIDDQISKYNIKVLDKGFVQLVNSMGSDATIVNSARVSYKGLLDAKDLTVKDKKLIRSLIERKHTSPFEHIQITFAVKAPIFVLRQWHRHRTWSFNEVSARYKEVSDDFYIPKETVIGHQMKHEKQMRDLEITNENAEDAIHIIDQACISAHKQYRELLALNVPRELARMVLPQNMYSEMYASVNLHNLMRFLILRQDEHAQYEIRQYANALSKLATVVAPFTMNAFNEYLEEGEIY